MTNFANAGLGSLPMVSWAQFAMASAKPPPEVAAIAKMAAPITTLRLGSEGTITSTPAHRSNRLFQKTPVYITNDTDIKQNIYVLWSLIKLLVSMEIIRKQLV